MGDLTKDQTENFTGEHMGYFCKEHTAKQVRHFTNDKAGDFDEDFTNEWIWHFAEEQMGDITKLRNTENGKYLVHV